MIKEIFDIIQALPVEHLIYGVISTVLCIAVAWVYSKSANNTKGAIIQATSYLVVFNEIAFQLYIYFTVVINVGKVIENCKKMTR